MTAWRYIEHVTLTSGHKRRSYREEVSDATLASLHDMLGQALASDERVAIPGLADYGLFARADGRCMMAQVWGEAAPLAVLGVAATERCGAPLWRHLHDTATPLATDPKRQPRAPWLAARIEYGAAYDLPAMDWLGDFERCLAWTFLARLENGSRPSLPAHSR